MAGFTCVAFLSCIWDPVQAALLSFVGNVVSDSLSSLRDWVVAEVRGLTLRWGNQVEQVPISSADLVGLQEIQGYLQQIRDYLKDDRVGSVGVYGMGGVGKTALLEIINNKFSEMGVRGFDVVIWVTVSIDANTLRIQKVIGDRLGLSLSAEGAGSSSQAEETDKAIFKALSRRRFVLLLDDVWEKLDLKQVGIPLPTAQNKCKIILTTRSKEVCRKMGVEMLVNVKVLNELESWKLFTKNVGGEVDLESPLIKPHAKAVVQKCGGLPLALITVGRAMADASWPGEWEEALEQLRKSPQELPGMKDEVLFLLKFSFERLRDENTKECLLYCCLFPEDDTIDVENLIDCWVGEGFLDATHASKITSARNRGHGTITRLISACLLERVNNYCVKMHDVVREMCLWLTGGEFDRSNTFLIAASYDSNRLFGFEGWGDVKRISLIHHVGSRTSREYLWPNSVPLCPKLKTLLFVPTNPDPIFQYPHVFRQDFCNLMPALRVLDLDYSRIESLPDEISSLVELRYLSLNWVILKSLPKGLGKLTNLRQLNIEHTHGLSDIPREAITTLTALQALRTEWSSYNFILQNEHPNTVHDTNNIEEKGKETSLTMSNNPVGLRDLETCLVQLEDLGLTIRTVSCLEMLLNLDRLCRCTRYLYLEIPASVGIKSTNVLLSTTFGKLENLRVLEIMLAYPNRKEIKEHTEARFDSRSRLGSLEELHLFDIYQITTVDTAIAPVLFQRLRTLDITRCDGIRDLTWVRLLPCLEVIHIDGCDGIEELLLPSVGLEGVRESEAPSSNCDSISLLKLRKLDLRYVSELKSISRCPLLLPSLEELFVDECPQLKKLPFGPDSAKNSLRAITCDQEWWEGLDWWEDMDGHSVKPRFLPYFRTWEWQSDS